MIKRILIIGGYGNFGSFISKALAAENNIRLIVAGRSLQKAERLVSELGGVNVAEAVALDIHADLEASLRVIKPDIVIHTSGPFQTQSYAVAKACIAAGAHYIDLADGRDFVAGITALDSEARARDVLVISGASSVPCLTAALVDYYKDEFQVLEGLDYGISTAQKTARGLATIASILGYTGKAFDTIIDGERVVIYGWQGLHLRKYKGVGWRMLGNCDIPDLALFPKRYSTLKTVRFYAGLEIPLVHGSLWAISFLVRFGLIRRLDKAAAMLLRMSYLFDVFGSDNSAFHMTLSGRGDGDIEKSLTFELTARSGDGPYIPCMPAILLAKKLACGELQKSGAYPCMGFITRDEYLGALDALDISWQVD